MSRQAQVSPLIITSYGPFHFGTNPGLSGSVSRGRDFPLLGRQGAFQARSLRLSVPDCLLPICASL